MKTHFNYFLSSGLCWGENAHVYGKDKFPYAEAALRSIKLWHHLTHAKVVMTLVHNDQEPDEHLLQYRDQLIEVGADVVLHKAEDLSCVLTSQLIRILAQYYHPVISDHDIVITADVDAFIMTQGWL